MMTHEEAKSKINQKIKEGKSKKAIFESLRADYTKQDELIDLIRYSVTTKQKNDNLFYNIILIGLLVASIIIKIIGFISISFNPIDLINILISCIVIYGLIQYKKWAIQLVIWFSIIVLVLLIIKSLDVKFDTLKFILTILSLIIGSFLKGNLFPKPIKIKQKSLDGVDEFSFNFKD